MGRPKSDIGIHKKVYEVNGEVKTLTEWCRIYGISRTTVLDRIKAGLSLYKALTIPPDNGNLFKTDKERVLAKTRKVCAKCRWSCSVDGHPACSYIDYPDHGRRPVSAEECTSKKPGSVFEPRKRGQWTAAQQEMFHERGNR